MSKKTLGVISISGYLLTMGIGILIGNIITYLLGNNVLGTMQVDTSNIIYKIIIQLPPTLFLLYIIKKYYKWEEIGLTSYIEKKDLFWTLPYVIVLIFMVKKFIGGFYNNMNSYNLGTYMFVLLTFIGTVMAGFCEEVIFRGILLNSFKSEKSIVWSMLISSVGFSIVHITTVVMGNSILAALSTIFYSSLLGFAFVGIAMKMKNIWFLVIFHTLWNFILMVSQTLRLELSIAVGICNILNIFIAIILWTLILISHRKKLKKYDKIRVP